MSHCQMCLSFLMINVPHSYMKDVFDKSCIGQAPTRNSFMKLSQPIRITNYGQYYISLSSVWNNLLSELKRCTNSTHLRENFLYSEDVNKNPS